MKHINPLRESRRRVEVVDVRKSNYSYENEKHLLIFSALKEKKKPADIFSAKWKTPADILHSISEAFVIVLLRLSENYVLKSCSLWFPKQTKNNLWHMFVIEVSWVRHILEHKTRSLFIPWEIQVPGDHETAFWVRSLSVHSDSGFRDRLEFSSHLANNTWSFSCCL